MKTDCPRLGEPAGVEPLGHWGPFLSGKLVPSGKPACCQSDFVEPAVPALVIFQSVTFWLMPSGFVRESASHSIGDLAEFNGFARNRYRVQPFQKCGNRSFVDSQRENPLVRVVP